MCQINCFALWIHRSLIVWMLSTNSPHWGIHPPFSNCQVHSYLHVPLGRTAYLSELCSGSEVLIVDGASGRQRTAIVGRAKVESRPLVSLATTVLYHMLYIGEPSNHSATPHVVHYSATNVQFKSTGLLMYKLNTQSLNCIY